MKSKVFYCDTHYRAALTGALVSLRVLADENISLKGLLQQTWWPRVDMLKPAQLLEIGCDSQGTRVFILSVTKDKELLPRITSTLAHNLAGGVGLLVIDALPKENLLIKWGRWLSGIWGLKYLSHLLFLAGIVKSRKEAWNRKVPESLLFS